MIQEVDQEIRDWCAATLKRLNAAATFAVFIGPVNRTPETPHVGSHLLDVRPGSPRLNSRRPAVEIVTRHLITVHHADDPAAAHRILGELILSALESPLTGDDAKAGAGMKIEIDPTPLTPSDWLAFGVPPRPSFVVRVPIRRERALPAATPVTKDIDVAWRAMGRLTGTVLGPADAPLPGAEVRVSTLGLTSYTDAAGRFLLAPIPSGDVEIELDVRFNGRERQVAAAPGRPIVIRLAAEATSNGGALRPDRAGISSRDDG